MDKHHCIAFYGGTFDPIHYGHLRSIIALSLIIKFKNIFFLPNNIPPHKPCPLASPKQRIKMIQLAIAEVQKDLLRIDTLELYKSTPSWTVESFEDLRYKYGPNTPLGLIIGYDSLLTLPKWHRSSDLLSLCHLLVCARPNDTNHLINKENKYWLTQRLINDPNKLYQQPFGLIYYASTPKLAISASNIRQCYREGRSCAEQLPLSVQMYINQQGLYR